MKVEKPLYYLCKNVTKMKLLYNDDNDSDVKMNTDKVEVAEALDKYATRMAEAKQQLDDLIGTTY
jgi:hypothetical protein